MMSLSKRLFRTKEAIETFEKCRQCPSLPANKIREVEAELTKARNRLEQQEAEVLYSFSYLSLYSPNNYILFS